jgi:hypothetical protein
MAVDIVILLSISVVIVVGQAGVDHSDLTVIRRGFTSALFGNVNVSTPWRNSAETLSLSTWQGSSIIRL